MRIVIFVMLMCGLGWATSASATTPYSTNGRITFVGAVLAPTCAVDVAKRDAANGVQWCSGSHPKSAVSATSFVAESNVLTTRQLSSDSLLNYYAQRLLTAGLSQPTMVTRTYR